MRKVAYTYIIGDYDDLKTPSVFTEGWDYVCFTDSTDLRSDFWDVRLSNRRGTDRHLEDKQFASKHLILFHHYLDDYHLSVSVGGQILINCDLDDFLYQCFKDDDDMLVCRHPWRDCIYEEAEACKLVGKDDPQRIDAQMQRYRCEGYPRHHGLYAGGLMARRHGRPPLNEMCELWFEEVKRGSRREQLSLNYALWKSAPLKLSVFEWEAHVSRVAANERRDASFIITPHKESKGK